MAARRNATGPTATRAGILRPEEFPRYAGLERTDPGAVLAPYVENHWTLHWDLPPGRTFLSQTLPHPAATVTVELGHPRTGVGDERVLLTGVVTERFDVTLAESGWVHGVKFRPGGLAALTGADAAAWADRTLPASSVLPPAVVTAFRALAAGTPASVAVGAVAEALADVVPTDPDPTYDLVLDVVSTMLADRDLVQVAQLEERVGVGRRRIERLFARYVGASPKWVLARYRMHDVVTDLDAGYDGSLADLAARYGWYDQAHFTRDFTRLVGVTPGEYRR